MAFRPQTTSAQAWEFLRRNPAYQADWNHTSPKTSDASGDYAFPIIQQAAVDLHARKWGLHAYAAPAADIAPATPFWAIGLTIEADLVENSNTPLFLLRKFGARISGLALLGGGLILKIDGRQTSVQLLLPNWQPLNETSGIALRLPVDLRLPARLARAHDFWAIASNEHLKKVRPAPRRTGTTSFSPLTA